MKLVLLTLVVWFVWLRQKRTLPGRPIDNPVLRQQLIAAAESRRAHRYTLRCGCGAGFSLSARHCPACGVSSDLAESRFRIRLPKAGRRSQHPYRAVVALGGLA